MCVSCVVCVCPHARACVKLCMFTRSHATATIWKCRATDLRLPNDHIPSSLNHSSQHTHTHSLTRVHRLGLARHLIRAARASLCFNGMCVCVCVCVCVRIIGKWGHPQSMKQCVIHAPHLSFSARQVHGGVCLSDLSTCSGMSMSTYFLHKCMHR